MPIIKSNLAPPTLAAFSMKDIEQQARAILLRAQRQVDQLLAEAQAQAHELKLAAHAQGFAEGRTEGLAKGREEGLRAAKEQALAENRQKLSQLVASLSAAARDIEASRLELKDAGARDVIGLAIAIASRIAKRAGQVDPSVAMDNVREALKLVVHSSDVRIAIHPSQKSAMEEALPAIKAHCPKLSHVQIVEDPTLAPGGCRIFTQQGQVDGDLDEQLRRICAELVPNSA